MNTKRLKHNPIIPREFYVKRGADRQIRRIIEEMGRPGYVLVARQMGKTNLLLNAKRELERESDCFLYMDVSNLFPDIVSFYRNIIDTALDAYPEKLSEAASTIRSRRLVPGLPHKEHELELRDILRAIQGKVIICFDEVDALAKTTYSDQVFSFLRSIYFSGRINFPEFNRLTYVLSGVAEPSALIKNKDVSPFNIGEKIYLEDFSISEFEEFVRISELNFSKSVSDRIYYWLQGNPRMTWDVCSQLEDLKNDGTSIDGLLVDKVIRDKYLTNFDVPPVDHLRKLAEEDVEVRQALMSLHYGKVSNISDALKSRLYLYGFVQLSVDAKPIQIKNRVIEETVSEEWLRDVESQKSTKLEMAERKVHEGFYHDALALYEEYLGSVINKDSQLSAHFSMGRCYVSLAKYAEAIQCFTKAQYSKEDFPFRFLHTQYYIGVCYRNLYQLEEAMEHLNIVVNESVGASSNSIKILNFDARVSMSSIYLSTKDYAKVFEISDSIINAENEIINICDESIHVSELMFAAHFNASLAAESLNDFELTKSHLIKGHLYADIESKPGVAARIAKIEITLQGRKEWLVTCANQILDGQIRIVPKRIDSPLELNPEIFLHILTQLRDVGDEVNFERLVNYLFKDENFHSMSASDIVQGAVFGARSKSELETSVILVDHILRLNLCGGESDRRNLLTFAIMLRSFEFSDSSVEMYFQSYWNTVDAILIESDYRLIYGVVRGNIARGDFERARVILDCVTNLASDKGSFQSDLTDIIIEYLNIFFMLKAALFDENTLLTSAINLVDRIAKLNKIESPLYFPEGVIEDIRSYLTSVVSHMTIESPFRRVTPKYGRNDKVTVRFNNGTILTGKFKRLESDILAGKCELISIL